MIKLICNSCDGKYDSIDIRFTKACDNNCPFCIEKAGLGSLGITNVEEIVKSVVKTGVKDILILGGEPMLIPQKVYEFVKAIRELSNGSEYKIYMTTSLPRKFSESSLICGIMDMIDGLNVSIQHYDSKINNDVLEASSRHDRLAILERLNKKYASKIRISINLSKTGIDCRHEIITCLRSLKRRGCKNIKINELQHSPDLYVSFEDIMGIKLDSPYSHGCQTDVTDKLFSVVDGMNIILKRSCFRVEPSRKASFADFIKTITKVFYQKKNTFNVIYENGKLNNCWIKK